MSFAIHLENFDGPLDLLLHLIRRNEMDIADIRIVAITEQYLEIIDRMKQLDLDVAGEFLLMAATLLHIKSRMLLPSSEDVSDEDEEDPRAELVQRLLEYQRYRAMAEQFAQLPQLHRDLFAAGGQLEGPEAEESQPDEDLAVSIYRLAEAFQTLLKERPREVFHEVVQENYAVTDYVKRIRKRLASCRRLAFRDFFPGRCVRGELIVTFLALLELVKMRFIAVEQAAACGEIRLVRLEALPDQVPDEELSDYA